MEDWQTRFFEEVRFYRDHYYKMGTSIEYRRQQKEAALRQLEIYRALFGASYQRAMTLDHPVGYHPRRSEHEPPLGFDTAGPNGSTFHYEEYYPDGPEGERMWKRERYGGWPDELQS